MLIDVGYGNHIESSRILAVCKPGSNPIRRMVAYARENGKLINMTNGKRTRSIVFLNNDNDIVLCEVAIQPQTIVNRLKMKILEENSIEKLMAQSEINESEETDDHHEDTEKVE